MNAQHFLQQDLHTADIETKCILDCLLTLETTFTTGDYKAARIAAENVARSFGELEKMHERKVTNDKIRRIITELQAEGIAAVAIKRGLLRVK